MKPVLMFIQSTCPYCRRALSCMEQLLALRPEYRQVELTVVDERREPEKAERYDYWYVPTYYVGGRKVHEGAASAEDVERVFAEAYAGK